MKKLSLLAFKNSSIFPLSKTVSLPIIFWNIFWFYTNTKKMFCKFILFQSICNFIFMLCSEINYMYGFFLCCLYERVEFRVRCVGLSWDCWVGWNLNWMAFLFYLFFVRTLNEISKYTILTYRFTETLFC